MREPAAGTAGTGNAGTASGTSPAYWGAIAVRSSEPPPQTALGSVGLWVRQRGGMAIYLVAGSATTVVILVLALWMVRRRNRRRALQGNPS
jgi:hypothetical protein